MRNPQLAACDSHLRSLTTVSILAGLSMPLPTSPSAYNLGEPRSLDTCQTPRVKIGIPGSTAQDYTGSLLTLDSLYLNVFAPASATTNSKLPVKVFVYGGAFVNGGSGDPLYSGCQTASDAIVVTIGYRNGPLGFLALEGTSIAGNQAVKDVVMAAQWVQNNIGAFGGDPVCHYAFVNPNKECDC